MSFASAVSEGGICDRIAAEPGWKRIRTELRPGVMTMRRFLEEDQAVEVRQKNGSTGRRWLAGFAVVLALFLSAGAVLLARAWPFTQANVIRELEQATSSRVQIGEFHRTFFPHVGCVAQRIALTRGSDSENQAVMTVETLTIKGTWSGLLSKHVALIEARGAHAVFPPLGSGQNWKPTESKVVVDQLIANEAVVEFSRNDKPPLKFRVDEFAAHHLATHDPMKFEVRVQNPEPPGEVRTNGTFGPWNMSEVSATPVEGSYSFQNANLGAFHGIGGTLSSTGQYRGTLQRLEVTGEASTPDFVVVRSGHKIELGSDFRAEVDALNGDVTLDRVVARVAETLVVSHGKVADQGSRKGKTANVELAVRNGRIQDLLRMFVSEKRAPLSGTVSLKANTVVPPGAQPFLQKLQMTGDFGVASGLFTKAETEEKLGKLSAVARGQPGNADHPENVVSDLKGHVVVRNGVATFSELSFRVPGALARLHGTFNLMNEDVNLHGTLFMEANLPKATSGIKSFFLKAIDPFLKKNRRGGAEFPVSITGTYKHPVYRADPV